MGSPHSILNLCLMIVLGLTGGLSTPSRAAQQLPVRVGDPNATNPVNEIRVVLLGTGTPNPRPDRFGPSILVEAGSERLIFDCGRSCTTRLWQLQIPLGTVKLFLSHLHSDHTVGIPDLWLTGFLSNPYGRRTGPFRVWGPEGTKAMMSNLEKAYEADIRIRQPKQGFTIDAKDFTEGVVYQENGVRVTHSRSRMATSMLLDSESITRDTPFCCRATPGLLKTWFCMPEASTS